MAKKNVLTPEVRTDAEKMIEAGRDPKQIQAYLAEHGSKNPSAHLYAIRNSMKKKAEPKLDSGHPEIKKKDQLAGLEPFVPEKKTVTFNGKEFERMEKTSQTRCQPAKPSGVTVPDQLPEEKPKKPSLRIREADGAVGTWRRNYETVSFVKPGDRPGEDDQEIDLTAEEWLAIMAELPNVLDLFGNKEAGA